MLMAITREVSPAMNRCELSYLDRVEIDIAKAAEQHRQYEACLRGMGAEVISLPAEPELPDSVFVEDPAVVVEEVGHSHPAGRGIAAAGRREPGEDAGAVPSAAMDAGAGHARRRRRDARRENALRGRLGAQQCGGHCATGRGTEAVRLSVKAVEVRGCLHLKSGCCSWARESCWRTATGWIPRHWWDCASWM